MNYSQHEARMRAYLRKELPPSEHAAFEAQLLSDAVLKKSFLNYCLSKKGVQEISMENRYREMAESVKSEIGPIPRPRLTLWDHLRFAMYRPLYRGLASATGIVLGGTVILLLYTNFGGIEPLNKISARFLILPECEINDSETAGKLSKDNLADIHVAIKRAKNLFCKGAIDSLQQSGDSFGFSDYYLANLQLKKQDWAAAETSLKKCLSNTAFIQQFSNAFGIDELRFNYLLAQLGNSGNYRKVQSDLVKLLDETSTGQLVREKAKDLQHEMSSPLRWFYFR